MCFLWTALLIGDLQLLGIRFFFSHPNPNMSRKIPSSRTLCFLTRLESLNFTHSVFFLRHIHFYIVHEVTLSFHLGSTASVLWSGGALGHGGIPDVAAKKWRRCPDAGTWGIPRRWPEGGADREGVPHCSPLCSQRWVSVRISHSTTVVYVTINKVKYNVCVLI